MGDMDNRRDPQKAREWYEKELEIVEKLVALEPDNTLYLHYLYLSFDRMGDIDGRQEPKKAREWYEKELEIAKKLVALEPENTEYLTDLSLSFNNIGNINGCQDPQKARQWYKKELEIAKKLVALEPDNSKLLRYLASSLSLIAETFLQQNMTEAECEYSLRAAEAMNRAAKLTPDDPYIQYGVACACARVGERGKALAALALSIELGNTNAKQSAEDPDLASLRELPEFESLLERMRQAGE
jgi:tetratricopeptide (TPR) repeat protein